MILGVSEKNKQLAAEKPSLTVELVFLLVLVFSGSSWRENLLVEK